MCGCPATGVSLRVAGESAAGEQRADASHDASQRPGGEPPWGSVGVQPGHACALRSGFILLGSGDFAVQRRAHMRGRNE
jgi:hypothetical protein